MRPTTAILVAILASLLTIGVSFGTWQSNQTERACIAAGRVIWAGHCTDPAKPGEVRIE